MNKIKNININVTAKVELTPEGLCKLKEKYNKLFELYPSDLREEYGDHIPGLVGNVYTTQLWEIMKDIGPMIKMGSPSPILHNRIDLIYSGSAFKEIIIEVDD